MEVKKSKKYDIEGQKPIYFQIGLVFALLLVLIGFEHKSYDSLFLEDSYIAPSDVMEEVVMQTKQEEPMPEPKSRHFKAQTILLNIIDNNVKVDNEIERSIEEKGDSEVDSLYQNIGRGDAEEGVDEGTDSPLFMVVQDFPMFPGGDEARARFLAENIKYPQLARDKGIFGTVVISFIIEKNGTITNPSILQEIGGGCGNEALRVVKLMPRWKPGKQRGNPVRTIVKLPVRFMLNQ